MARKAYIPTDTERTAARISAQMKRRDLALVPASNPRFKVQRVPSGSLTIDRITGGGYARGRHVELYGDWSAGKSLLTYLCMILAQQRGELCALVDGEHVFDQDWFKWLGGNLNNLLIYTPDTADELASVLQLFVYGDDEVANVKVVGVDSVASMLPREELEKDIQEGNDRVASLARLMSRLLRRVTTQNDDTLFIWTNQWRDKISRIPGLRSTPGGRALGFYASVRVEMQLGQKETAELQVVKGAKWVTKKVPVGQWVNCTAAKNKLSTPLKEGSYLFNFNERGIDLVREAVDLGMQDGIITRVGDKAGVFTVHDAEGREYKATGITRFLRILNTTPGLIEWVAACIEERTLEVANGGS